ncbi:MAG: hypothetical protein HC837_18870 [Chloroflexaceae bacterium]|nr:hypothetical protein [Chloroflexaceae bacterium]
MTYSDFSLVQVCKTFGLVAQTRPLFSVTERTPPVWLTDLLKRGRPFALGSEKARSEFLVVPMLLTWVEQSELPLSVYSGQRLDADPALGLVGECDFLLARTPPLPFLQAPIVALVEAKKHDIEAGMGQCAAQMVGARAFNEREGVALPVLFGCVTSGEAWQFLQLEHDDLLIDADRYYLDNVARLLGVFAAITAAYAGDASAATVLI